MRLEDGAVHDGEVRWTCNQRVWGAGVGGGVENECKRVLCMCLHVIVHRLGTVVSGEWVQVYNVSD